MLWRAIRVMARLACLAEFPRLRLDGGDVPRIRRCLEGPSGLPQCAVLAREILRLLPDFGLRPSFTDVRAGPWREPLHRLVGQVRDARRSLADRLDVWTVGPRL